MTFRNAEISGAVQAMEVSTIELVRVTIWNTYMKVRLAVRVLSIVMVSIGF